jgi:DNA modification methylase
VAKKNRIEIKCKGAENIPCSELVPLQGNLKELSEENYQKLRREILDLGFSEPISVWKNDGKNFLLNGHQRQRVIKRMIDMEGFECPPLPVSVVEATTLKEAQKKILSLTSQYGAMTPQGLYEFSIEAGLSFDEINESFRFPEIDMDEWKLEFFGETGDSDGSEEKGSLSEKFLVPPFSILDARQGYWKERKAQWLNLGIRSELGREHLATTVASTTWMNRGNDSGGSIFDPVLCEIACRWFSPIGGTVIDPFAGGSVRGVVASLTGRQYIGVELRKEQVEANREQADELCRDPVPVWHCGDSRHIQAHLKGVEADLVFSCPPYADLEVYSDDPADLSTLKYPEFLDAYREIIKSTLALLKNDRFACFVVGEVRGGDSGFYYNFVADTIAAFQDHGARFYNEAILASPIGSLPVRAGRQFSATRKLGKTHQNILIFCKGDPKKATAACGEVQITELAEAEDE